MIMNFHKYTCIVPYKTVRFFKLLPIVQAYPRAQANFKTTLVTTKNIRVLRQEPI